MFKNNFFFNYSLYFYNYFLKQLSENKWKQLIFFLKKNTMFSIFKNKKQKIIFDCLTCLYNYLLK